VSPLPPRWVAPLLAAALAAPAAAEFPWFGAPQKPAEPIVWIDDPAEAVAVAARTGKPIVAFVTSDKCAYCKKMEKLTWSEPAIGRLVGREFVPLRLHAGDHPEAVAALRVRAYPTTVLISPEGKAFAGKAGFLEPLELAGMLRPAVPARAAAIRLPPVR